MKTLSIKIQEALLEKLDSVARKRGETRSIILREAIESIVDTENQIQKGSCLDLANDLAGTINGRLRTPRLRSSSTANGPFRVFLRRKHASERTASQVKRGGSIRAHCDTDHSLYLSRPLIKATSGPVSNITCRFIGHNLPLAFY